MRVLHLAPPAVRADALTAHTFIDEEIAGLRDQGVECLVMSDAITADETRCGVDMVAARRPRGLGEWTDALAWLSAQQIRHRFRLPLGRDALYALRIESAVAAAVRRHRVDVVHSHFGWPGGFGGGIAARAASVPLVASIRGMDVLQREELGYGLARERSYARALRLMLRHASRTVYATEFMRRNGIRAGAPRSRTVVVRKGVDLGRFHPAADRPSARRALGVDTPVILAVGSLHPRKGHACVLRALALVRDVPWTFVVCGDGGERTGLETQVQETGLQGRVRFLGSVSREMIGRYFSIADVFVHGALLEAAGNVILEALASGCAVVATASGGPEEYLADGMTGFTVAVGDAPAMAARIRELLSNPRLRLSISDAARQSAEQQYSYARMVRELIGVYQRASDAWLLTPEENRPATAGRAA